MKPCACRFAIRRAAEQGPHLEFKTSFLFALAGKGSEVCSTRVRIPEVPPSGSVY